MTQATLSFTPGSAADGAGAGAAPGATAGLGRASWSGFLKLGLVTVPVRAFPLVVAREEVELHQLHAPCGRRIRLQKYCPDHGPVDGADVVKGYQYAPDQHVVLDPADLERLRPASDKTVSLERFADEGAIEPGLFAGRSLYLLPDGPAAQRSYAVLAEALRGRRRWAVGRATLSGRRSAVVVRRYGRGLALDVLHDPARLQRVEHENATAVVGTAEEVALLGRLIDAATGEVRWSDYRDDAAEKLAALVDAKLRGRELPAAPAEAIAVLPLLDALKQSLAMLPEPASPRAPSPRKARARTSAKPTP